MPIKEGDMQELKRVDSNPPSLQLRFLILPLLFVIMGTVFLVVGFLYGNSILRFMGLFWIPSGLLCLVIVIYHMKKEKEKQ